MYSLTNPQKLIYNMEQYAGGSIAVICGSILIDGESAPSQLTDAIREVFRLNDALRTRIIEKDGVAFQQVVPFEPYAIDVLHFDSEAQLHSYAESCAKEPIPLSGKLCDIQAVFLPDRFGIIVKCHHIIGDAWTLTLICSQLIAILAGEKPPAFPYTDYVESEAAYVQSLRYSKDRTFFMEQFKTCDEVTYLSEKNGDSYAAQRMTFHINAAQAAQIHSYARKYNTSPFALFLTAFAVYFSRVKMNVEKFYIGTPVLNRGTFKEKNTMGMFINTVPVLANVDYDSTFADNLAVMQKEIFSVLRHQKFYYNDVLTTIRQEFGFTEQLYDVVLSYQNAVVYGADSRVETTWYHNGLQTESLQIHIDDRDGEGSFRIQMDYRMDKFTAQEIGRMYVHILNLLLDAIANDFKKPGELELLSIDEKQQLLLTFNDTATDYPRDKCVHQLFETQVEKTPNKTAVIACDRTLSYQELNEEANRIAHGLISQGVKPGDIVAFALPRNSHLIPAMFGILKAGAAYLPIDPDYPQERINYMLRDSQAKLLITAENIVNLIGNDQTDNPTLFIPNKNLCYCIYTSGTTGQPKGILIAHRNVINFVQSNEANVFQNSILSCCEYFVSANSVSFDITLQEIHLPLLNGRSIILLSDEQIYDIGKSAHQLKDKNCGLIITPTKLGMYMADQMFCDNLQNITCIMCGAETFTQQLRRQIQKYTNAVIFNGYGPTETTCGVLYSKTEDVAEITIGRPITNTQIYVVDKHLNPVPIGVVGELCIAGDGVGAGYLNLPELTAEKFIDNPFGEGKLYKTGDLAYWREDGNIVYVGRNDFQVKIRGLRIELGEIENAIAGVDGIGQAVVIVRKDDTGRQLICAFYTETAPVQLEAIKTALREKLPRYMMPHIFTRLDALPMTTSSKVNRKALPEADLSSIQSDIEYVRPKGVLEVKLAGIMEQVLHYSPVGREDNFFDLGGDSLKAIEFVAKAHTDGIYFSLQNIFDCPTVKSLCQNIDNSDKSSVSYEDINFTQINSLLAENCVERTNIPSETDVGDILLAGATGFLGIHLLDNYLEHDTGIAYCLVRGKDQADSEKRLAELLEFYFGDKYGVGGRIQVVCGDLQKEVFGLTKAKYQTLQEKISTVINAAASVKHYGSYRYFYETNVESVNKLISFCKGGHAKLIHISTLSVSGNGFDSFDGYVSETEKHFYENNLYIGQPLENVYARSKFEAEKLVLEAMADGLSANIMRMGNLTNRLSDGAFQINHETNAFAQRIKGILELGMVPDYLIAEGTYVEFTPIDEASRAIMTIARHFSKEQTVFHINNTKLISFERLIESLCKLGCPVKVAGSAEFAATLRKTEDTPSTKHIFETFINYLDKNDRLNYDSNIRIENGFTEEYLRQLGFTWPEIEIEYLRKYVAHFKKIGYWGCKNV